MSKTTARITPVAERFGDSGPETASGNALCVELGGAVQLSGHVTYVKQ